MSIPINDGQAAMRRIVSLLENKRMSLAEFARQMGVTPAYVSNWRRRGIPTDRLPRAADILKTSVDNLLGRVEDMPTNGMPVLLSGRIPVVGRAQLGDDNSFAEFSQYDDPDGFLSLPSRDPLAYALKCEGSSMMPRIQPGEFVIAEPSFEAYPGDEVVVQDIHNRVMVKRFLYWRDGNLYLGSINETHGNVILPADEVKAVHPVLAIIPKKLWNPR